MFIVHLALGGCMKAPPVSFGLTADTGGHIAYVLDAATAQAATSPSVAVSIVTRLIDDARLGEAYRCPHEPIGDRVAIDRIASGSAGYLEKEALACDLPGFTEAFCAHLAGLPQQPDVIHAHFADAVAVGLAARARFGIPVVYTPHALGLDKRDWQTAHETLGWRIDAERRAIAEADAIIVSTGNEAERQIGAYGVPMSATRTVCLPPGVPHRPLSDHAPSGRAADIWSAGLDRPALPIVLAIARPVPKKNLAALVRAFAATPALVEQANLVMLAGQHGGGHASGEERTIRAELDRLCEEHGLRGHVSLPPRHDRADVAALYDRASHGGVFVNPALHEPFGLTLIEAAAAGVPVVATRHGGPQEIVERIGHGLLVDPRDEAAIGAACLAIVGDPELHGRLSRAALLNVRHYDWDRYAQKSLALYESLRRRPSSPAAAA